MKYLICLLFAVLIFSARQQTVEESLAQPGGTGNPVSVELVWPTNNTVLSGKLTLTAYASSLAAPIQRVEFYDIFCYTNGSGVRVCTTNLIGTVTNDLRLPPPENLFLY